MCRSPDWRDNSNELFQIEFQLLQFVMKWLNTVDEHCRIFHLILTFRRKLCVCVCVFAWLCAALVRSMRKTFYEINFLIFPRSQFSFSFFRPLKRNQLRKFWFRFVSFFAFQSDFEIHFVIHKVRHISSFCLFKRSQHQWRQRWHRWQQQRHSICKMPMPTHTKTNTTVENAKKGTKIEIWVHAFDDRQLTYSTYSVYCCSTLSVCEMSAFNK